MHLGVRLAVIRTHPGSVSLQSSSLNNVAAKETKLQTIVIAATGIKQLWLLQS
jgi:hypothetical protein